MTVLCSVLVGLSAAPAAADLPPDSYVVTLPTAAFRDLAVDHQRGRVFVSDGSPTVLVRDRLGKATALLPGLTGAAGLAVSADRATVYVAVSGADAIAAVDAETLTERARYATGAGTCPATVAEADGRVWFGYGCTAGAGRVGVLDLTGARPVVSPDRTGTAYWAPPAVAAGPGRLVVGGRGLTSYALTSYAVSGTSLTPAGTADAGAALHDLALTDDAAHVVTATAADAAHRRHAATLVADAAYAPGTHPTAVAVSGRYVATGASAALRVHDGAGALVRSYGLDGPLVPGSLAFAAGGALLYAVTGEGDAARRLHVLRYPTKLPTTMSLTPPDPAPRIGEGFALGGVVTSATPLSPGSPVYVTRTSTDAQTYLPAVDVGSGGAFRLTDLVTRRGTYTYTATYYGDTTHGPAQRSVQVTVRGYVPDLAIATNRATYAYGDTARVTARLGPTYTNRWVTITAQPLNGSEVTVASGRVDTRGVLTGSFPMRARTTFRARFGGDALYDPRTVARTATAGVVLRQRLSGQYAAVAGIHYFRTTARPVLKVGVHPGRPGSCVTARLQRYTTGTWQTVATRGCVPLAWDSTASFTFDGPFLRGLRYRVRSAFSGDAYNAPTTGTWLHLAFT